MQFRLALTLLLILPQLYLAYRFWRWAGTQEGRLRLSRIPVLSLFALFTLGMLWVVIAQPRPATWPNWMLLSMVYPFLLWHSATYIIALVLLAGAVIKFPFAMIWRALLAFPPTRRRVLPIRDNPSVRSFDASRRLFLQRGVYGLTALSFGGAAYGMILGREGCEVTERDIRIPGLPPGLAGLTIGLVTDVHSSLYMRKADMDDYVRRLNDLGVDIIVVGGDLVNSSVDEVYPFAESFSQLKAPLGVFGVLGNHDYYTRQPNRIAEVATQAGVRILRNEQAIVHRHGARLRIAGVDDAGSDGAAGEKMDAALQSHGPRIPTVLICHRPYFLDQAAERNVELVLSGHTHGGQVVLGRFGSTTVTPAAMFSQYVWGPYRRNSTQMYVSRGIGTVGVPIRLNCPPELTRLTLRPA